MKGKLKKPKCLSPCLLNKRKLDNLNFSLPKTGLHFKSLRHVRQYKCSSQSSKHGLMCTITHSLKVCADPVSRLLAHQCQVFLGFAPGGQWTTPCIASYTAGTFMHGWAVLETHKDLQCAKENAILSHTQPPNTHKTQRAQKNTWERSRKNEDHPDSHSQTQLTWASHVVVGLR